jgi:hypothetical protein
VSNGSDFLRNARERAEYGCVTSWRNADGKTLTLVRTGPPRVGIDEMCDVAIGLDPSFRLTAYSTPETVYDDVSSNRGRYRGKNGEWRDKTLPEISALAAIGRRDLAHRSLGA